jgi:N-acetylglucosamine transport system permease protein
MTTTTADRAELVAGSRAPDQRAREGRGVATTAHIALILWSLLVIVPLLWTLLSSFKSTQEVLGNPLSLPGKLRFSNYANAWTTAGIGRYFVNTVIVVGTALVLVMILGAMCAYVLARFSFPGNRLIYYSMLAGLTFPVFLAIVPLFFTLKNFGLLNTLPGLIVTYVAFALPFTVFFLHSFFKALPGEIYEAAQIDGAGEWRTFFSVMLPMARPGMASVASQAGYAVDFGALFAAVVITVAPVLVVYIIFQRQLQVSVTAGGVK